MIPSDTEAREIIDTALGFASGTETRVNVGGGRHSNTRFALNSVTTCGDVDSLAVAVTAYFGQRHATATTTETDRDALRRVVATAEELARVAPEDPEYVPELGPQEYLPLDPWADATAEATPEVRAGAAQAAIDAATARGLESSGYYEHGHGASAVGNSQGLFGWSRGTHASFTVTFRTEGGGSSGWASANSRDIAEVDHAAAVRRALEKAEAGRDPQPLEPGVYPVILEPQAVADFVRYAVWCMDARRADEGRSFFTRPGGGNKIGEQVVGANITLRSDPTHPAILGSPFGGDGLPNRAQTWVEGGTLQQLYYDRYWAHKQGKEPTGSPSSLILEGGEGSVDDLIQAADRAVLVTRFWYIRYLDPQTILLTGLTRDGLFWVEGGQIRHGLRNFRFNESPIAVLSKVTAMSEPVRVGGSLVPAIAASEFTFSSTSESV